jgi:hypothetical protein
VLCCITVGGISLLHCARLVVRVGVFCYIAVGEDPRTLLSAAPGLTAALGFLARKRAVCIAAEGIPKFPFSAALGLAVVRVCA